MRKNRGRSALAAVVAVLAGGIIAVISSSSGSDGGVSSSDANPTYTGPLSGYQVHDPQNTAGAAAQIEGVIYNSIKNMTPPPYVSCQQSAPDQYSCPVDQGQPNADGSPNVAETVDVQVNTSDGSLIANCVDANGNNEPCALGGP